MTERPFTPADPNFEQTVRASFARQGLMSTFGARLAEVSAGRVVIETPFSASLAQQQGLFHGGVVGAIADSAGGYAALSLMPAGAEVVSVEYKINFLRPAIGPLLRATGHVARAGKTLSIGRIDVTCGPAEAQAACAILQATFMRVATAGS
jgi:uncharacterized protein (TIGR00369 family)